MSKHPCGDASEAGLSRGRGRLAIAVAVLASFGFACGGEADSVQVRLLNGLDFPVTLTVSDVEIRLAPREKKVHELSVGRHKVTARGEKGGILEEKEVEVPAGADVVAYNVLGAAPLVLVQVTYDESRGDSAPAVANSVASSLAGVSWVVRRGVDYPFQEAPPDLRLSSGQSAIDRTRVDVWDGGWKAAVAQLAADGRTERAAALARRVSRLMPTDVDAMHIAYQHTVLAGDTKVTLAFAEEVVRAAPASIPAHRIYQDHMDSHGALSEILEKYEAAWLAEPDSPRQGYLYARIAPFAVSLPIYEKLVPMYPDNAWLRRGIGWVYFQTGRFAEALPHYRKLVALRPDEIGVYAIHMTRALASEGRHQEAVAMVGSIIDAAPRRGEAGQDPLAGAVPWMLMRLYARLERLAPSSAEGPTIAQRWRLLAGGKEPEPGLLAVTAARARNEAQLRALRDQIADTPAAQYCDLTMLSKTDVEAAAKLALSSEAQALSQLDTEVKLALACELARLGHRARAEAVLKGLLPEIGADVSMEHIDALPDMTEFPEALDAELRAVMFAAASRKTDDEAQRAALLERARHFDALDVVVPE